MIRDKYKQRSLMVKIALAFVVAIFVVRLLMLQMYGDYVDKAEGNAFYKKTTYAPRGLIYDRDGRLLVYNQPTYDLMLTEKDLNRAAKKGTAIDTLELCDLLNITKVEFEERIAYVKDRRKNRGYSPLTPQRFLTQLSPEEYAVLQEKLRKFPGFSVQSRTLRNYSYPCGAHVLGSIGEVSRKTIEKDDYYKQGDYSGVNGLELAYEKQLRGENGQEVMLRDARGRLQGKYKDGALDTKSEAGENIVSSLDIELQMLAEELLRGKVGSVVAIEPSTGEILAMASNPTWDPSLLVGRLRSEYYPILLEDKMKPLLNRATQGRYSPGSTFKTVQALVCLQQQGVTEHTHFHCDGYASKPIRCTHTHGTSIDLGNALQESCNPYFWMMYKTTLEKNGYGEKNSNFKEQYNIWRKNVMSFGFGPKFKDTDVLGQVDGGIPTVSTYDKWYGERGWRALTIRSNSIGQGEVQVTPLQLANSVAAIANSGYYITPHLNRHDTMKVRRHECAVDKKYYSIVQHGMWLVCDQGSGRFYNVPELQMCGKTGTVDNSHGKPHSLFIGYAPKDDPKIAIAVVVENSGFGSMWASPIASLCMEQYLTDTVSRPQLRERMRTTILNPDVKTF